MLIVVNVSLSSDMLQLINNQDMEFGGLFYNHPYTVPPPTQELPGLTQSIILPSPPTTTTTSVPPPPSILSSSPHLDALLGPPITRSSSTPDKAFQPPTFQLSPLAKVPNSTQRLQPASPPQAQALRQPQVEQPQPILSPSAPAKAASPHGSPAPNPAFTSTPQAIFTAPAPTSPPLPQPQPLPQLQPQPQQQALHIQPQSQQILINYSTVNSYTSKHSLIIIRVYCSAKRSFYFVMDIFRTYLDQQFQFLNNASFLGF